MFNLSGASLIEVSCTSLVHNMFFNNFFIENTEEELFNHKITYQMTNCLIITYQLTVMVNFYYKALMLR